KRAKLARLGANVREIDVAVHDVRDRLAGLPPPELVGNGGERRQLDAVNAKERHDVCPLERASLERALEQSTSRGASRPEEFFETRGVGNHASASRTFGSSPGSRN